MALIEIRGLTKFYRMGDSVVHALDGVDLTIEAGEFVAITGASGSGKSTMMHLIGCLDRPTAGTYFLNGRNVSDLSDRELADIRNRYVGFVFQTFNLINRTTALDNVGVPLFYARKGALRGPALRALERVGLEHRAHHRPNELSGGERQRVAIARAIVNDPVLLLADEPTGNLDSRTGEQIMQVFHALNAQGVTIILVTHEPDVASQARRIVHMKDGRIVSDRPNQPTSPGTRPHQPGEPVVIARKAAVATLPPIDEPPLPAPAVGAALRAARPARGATSVLICGVLAPLLCLSAWSAARLLGKWVIPINPDGRPPDVLTPGQMTFVATLAFAILAGLVLGVIAIVRSRGILRQIAREPGVWLGAGRARIGQICGWVAVASLPVLALAGGAIAQ
jgi:putative ABC transport system ATP-binding protein